MKNELLHSVALTQLDGVGYFNAKKIIDYFGTASAFFENPKEAINVSRISKKILSESNLNQALKKAYLELDFIEKNNIQTFVLNEPNYPEYLKECPDAPIVLFGKGDLDLNRKRIISVVGTRKITAYGKAICKELIDGLPDDVLIVSGLAYGVDVEIHRLAIEKGISNVAVLAHGLDRIYPSAHSGYAKEMMKNGGLLSDFVSGTNPDRENFPKRNRIVAGMSEATIVIESAQKGGSLITANVANSYDREVFAFPGKSTDVNSKGCNLLIKNQKALLVESAEDIMQYLNWNNKKTSPKQMIMPIGLTPEEQSIYEVLKQHEKLHFDELASKLNLASSQLSVLLLNMEFSGIVNSIPGKNYQLN